jgi:hypothetical protein
VLLRDQGLAIVRRNQDSVYVALDYGHTGGGHGHPDRLNLWLVNDGARVLEDVGTGSYVDPSLHWYRSTLAHNAPLVDGRRQDPVDGNLRAWAEANGFTLVDADAEPTRAVPIRRRLVVGPEYLIDTIEWTASRAVTIDLPLHVEGGLEGVTWVSRDFPRAESCDDGFHFVRSPEWTGAVPGASITANGAHAFVHAPVRHEWWRFVAPGPPGQGDRPFFMLRCGDESGRILMLWDWSASVGGLDVDGDTVRVTRADGTLDIHRLLPRSWTIEHAAGAATELVGSVASGPRSRQAEGHRPAELRLRVIAEAPRRPGMLSEGEAAAGAGESLRFRLAGDSWYRSEQSWEEAGAPEAVVTVAATRHELLSELAISKEGPVFMPHAVWNPLDNEHPDTNSDGIQLAVTPWEAPTDRGAWILVPEDVGGRVRVTSRGSDAMPITAMWRLTSGGYQVLARVGLDALRSHPDGVDLGVIVNEKPASRARRRGQLVLGATRGGWTWLRGDRHDPAHLLPVRFDRG